MGSQILILKLLKMHKFPMKNYKPDIKDQLLSVHRQNNLREWIIAQRKRLSVNIYFAQDSTIQKRRHSTLNKIFSNFKDIN